jgi:hypothetical protein
MRAPAAPAAPAALAAFALLACLAGLAGLTGCSPDPVATVKAWKPDSLGGQSLGAAVRDYPYFKYAVWDYFQQDPDTTVVEVSGEFDITALDLRCPDIYSQDATPAYRAFCVLRLALNIPAGTVAIASARIMAYDAKGYYYQADADASILAGLAANDKLLDCLTLYAKRALSGM